MPHDSQERAFEVSWAAALLRLLLPPGIFAIAWFVVRAFEPDISHGTLVGVGLGFFVHAVFDLRRWRLVVVSPQGIRNATGKLVPWSAISTIVRYPGLPGGVLVNSSVGQISIVRSIARQPEFQAAVRACLPTDAPLLAALDRYRRPASAT